MSNPPFNIPVDDNGLPLERASLERAKFKILPTNTVSVYTVSASDDLIAQVEDAGTYTYVGKATPGTAVGTSAWQVVRITNATGVKLFASSDTLFDKSWNGRTLFSYG